MIGNRFFAPRTPTTPQSRGAFGPLKGASESSADGENAEQDVAPARTQPLELYCFAGGVHEGVPEGLPFHLADYLDLVNWTGRAVRDDKRGAVADDLPPILERIGITRAARLQLADDFETHFCSCIGQAEHVERVGQRSPRGIRACWRLFPS